MLRDVEPLSAEDSPGPSQPSPSDASISKPSDVNLHSLSQHVSALASSNAYQLTRTSDIRLPWQKGPLAPIFSRNSGIFRPLSVWNMPRVGLTDVHGPRPVVQATMQCVDTTTPAVSFARQRIAASKFYVPEDELRTKALNQFKFMLLLDLKATRLGTSMLDAVGSLDTSADVLAILSDALSSKATGTLIKRAGSMWRFAQWLSANNAGSCFGQSEHVVYQYLQHLKSSGSAPTSACHFVEALGFSDSIFQFTRNAANIVLSPRVRGAAHAMFLGKRILKQAPAFTVECVEQLEDICIHSKHPHHRVIAGSILFCIFACARWSDAKHIQDLKLDKYVTFIILEAATARHKTSMSKEAKTRLLPFTCLGKFLSEESWAESYVRARKTAGLDEQDLFQPSWNDMNGTWSSHPMTAGECNCWLNEFLGDMGPKNSSHSCKTTLLTWAGMTNLFTREERTLLGHHIEANQKSATTYNRDSQLMLMYKVQRLINLIKDGHLKPDASRAERLCVMFGGNEGQSNEEPAKNIELVDEPPPELVSGSDSGDAELSDDNTACLGLPGDNERGDIPVDSIIYTWYVHRLSSILHAKSMGIGSKLCCGREVTSNLKELEHSQINAQLHLMCHQCNSVVKQGFTSAPSGSLNETD